MPFTDEQADAVLDNWRGAAPHWQQHADTVRQMFGPVTAALIEAADIHQGDAVLDIAGGTGEPAMTIAELIAPLGAVMCTDAVVEMLAVAEHEALRRKITNIAFQPAPAEDLPFDGAVFDALTCRLGVMFLSDTQRALREMLRVAKPGAKLALAVWSGRQQNPFFEETQRILSRFVEVSPEEPDGPGAFRYEQPGQLAALTANAGWDDIREFLLDFQMNAPIRLEQFWELKSELSGSVRAAVAKLSEPEKLRIADLVKAAVGPYFASGEMSMPARVLIVSACKLA
jgi:SAM-dependent methyltransferase